MTSTISNGALTVTPVAVNGYASARESANIVHQIVGTNVPAITIRGVGLRSGTLECHMGQDRALASLLESLLGSTVALTYASTDSPALNMQFVVTDSVAVELDDTRTDWIVRFGFQEIN